MNYSSSEGVLFNKEKTELITYPLGKTGKSYAVPDGVVKIYNYAALPCKNLKSVSIPDSVTDIGNYSFGYYSATGGVIRLMVLQLKAIKIQPQKPMQIKTDLHL